MATPRDAQHTLVVPLDASGVADFKPERGLKVAIVGEKGRVIASEKVKLDDKGRAEVRFAFAAPPGNVRVLVGPDDANDDEIVGLQTLGVSVSADVVPRIARQAAAAAHHRLLLAPLAALVPLVHDPRPRGVPRRLAGAGRQGLRVRRRRLVVVVEPAERRLHHHRRQRQLRSEVPLVLRLVALVVVGPARLAARPDLGRPHPQADGARAAAADPAASDRHADARRVLAAARRAAAAAAADRRSRAARLHRVRGGLDAAARSPPTSIDTAQLPGLRERLIKVLPASPEFEKLQIWPWFPLEPWFDCAPDIAFRVTQNCGGEERVILNEPWWRARWNVDPVLDVTLVATGDACCIPH